MAEENEGAAAGTQAADGAPEGRGEQQAPEPDYRALYEQAVEQSRKWERRAKQAGGRVQEELDAANAELARLRAEREREEAVAAVAGSSGLPEQAVRALRGDTAEELAASASLLRSGTSAYPLERPAGQVAARPLTRADIEAIEDRDARLDAMEKNAGLWR